MACTAHVQRGKAVLGCLSPNTNAPPFPKPSMLNMFPTDCAIRSTIMKGYISPPAPQSIIDTPSKKEVNPTKCNQILREVSLHQYRTGLLHAVHSHTRVSRVPQANATHRIIIRSSLETMKSCGTNPGMKKRATAGTQRPPVKSRVFKVISSTSTALQLHT